MSGYRLAHLPWLIDTDGRPVGIKEMDGDEIFFPTFNKTLNALRKPDGSAMALGEGGGAALDTLPAVLTVDDPAVDSMALVVAGAPSLMTIGAFFEAVGVSIDDLPAAGALSGSDIISVLQGGVEKQTTLNALAAFLGAAPAPDTTAPTLSSPTSSATSSTTASGSVTTDDATGTLYFLATVNATETAATVKANGATQAISSTGSKAVNVTGLTAATTYYLHFVHTDAAGNDSARVSSASFTTSAVADTTAPTLSSPTGTQTGSTTASGSVSTNEASGTLYRYVSTNAVESVATVKAANLTQAVNATGVQNVNFTGLAASTQYYAHFVHRDAAGNDSTVASSAAFTTAAPAAPSYTITGYNGNAPKATIDATSASVYGSLKQITTAMQDLNTYYNISPVPASAVAGWGTSNTVAPSTVTSAANANGASSVNGMVTMTKPGSFQNKANLWVPVGSAGPFYFWVKPVDGDAFCVNPGGTTITGA